jgi:Gnt-I system high-affinity gluconate transporter
MSLLIVLICIVLLILLISWGKVNPFLALLLVSFTAGLLLGIPASKVTASVQKGFGDTLGSIVLIIALGAMLGKLVAESGAAQKISAVLMHIFGPRHIQWALMITGFILGIPLFYGVGFVLLVPLVFSVVYQYRLPAVYIGLPMIASLSVTHGFLPPHPSPVALASQFGASIGLTLVYGIIIAIPTVIIAGPVFAKTVKNITATPLETFRPNDLPPEKLPGTANSFLTALLPVLLLVATSITYFVTIKDPFTKNMISFLSDATIVMLLSLIVATFSLGVSMGKTIKEIMAFYGESLKDITLILLIIGAAGALKQVLADSGISQEIAQMMQNLHIAPLILGWLIAAIIRICIGSATVAGLTAAGIIAPLITQAQVNPNLMVLSIGAGSLVCSHVNDSGFWMFKEYFNLSMKETFSSWTIMETLVAVIGLAGVLLLDLFV